MQFIEQIKRMDVFEITFCTKKNLFVVPRYCKPMEKN